ncbi:MAG TPA: glycerophosphodiester phosphodiesterase family protein [Mycobacteriales bacterium]|nr:glycerophosphodiester phosphodiesterase family protein [Mycobacteriales bacterium]
MRRVAAALAALAVVVAGAGAHADGEPARAAPQPCDQVPEPARWSDAGQPDRGLDRAVLAAHRGAAELAPENTLWAFRYAIAYDVELIEVDVQQTADHRYVAFHDYDVERRTDGRGLVPLMTFEQVRALNAADNDRWRGSAYDPAQIPSLEEVLALASEHGVGVMLDLKESVTDTASVALMTERYGLVEESLFLPYVPGRAEQIKAAVPGARMMLSNQFFEPLPPDGAPRGAFYALSAEYDAFGSSLPGFDAERIAEAHDGCALVVPNVYQGEVTGSEAGDLLHARALGADGAQVDNPDVAVAVLGRPVATTVAVRPDGAPLACLLDAEHRQGLPGKPLHVAGRTETTGVGGCVPLPAHPVGRIVYGGDDSATGSSAEDA